jgi:hypothetical protein
MQLWLKAYACESDLDERLTGQEACWVYQEWLNANGFKYEVNSKQVGRQLGIMIASGEVQGISDLPRSNKGVQKLYNRVAMREHFGILGTFGRNSKIRRQPTRGGVDGIRAQLDDLSSQINQPLPEPVATVTATATPTA